ncbi:cation diffusion facilitator family transporter [Chryseolinea serpens]|uniref:Cation diffusion facilitator family transporter n=1 Tax=Chryseolinea serpens TaxID=947013 RepID=A0A1M5LYR2_9BACT|nr:cation diffusion facilitator family transporter [Chryseolinea serpens]SHG69533.1 cation diffusion facilitator family transporter [Chryseolinea serpens]
MDQQRKNIRIQRGVAILSVALLLIKLVAYYLTHSVAVLTDALESIVNVVAGFVGLYSLIVSAKPRDADHPYGHGKVEYLSAALEGSMIAIAGVLIFYKSITNLIHPEAIHQLDVGIVLIMATALVNYFAGSICIREGKKSHSVALVASGKHLQSDTYSTLGILVGLVAIFLTHLYWLDSVVAMLFSGVILYTSYKIIRTSIAGIMDESDTELLAELVATLNDNRRENWIDLHNLRIIKYGSILHLDCHQTVPWYLNVNEAHAEIDALAEPVRKAFGESLELFVHSDGCLEFSCRICSKSDCPVRKHPFERRVQWTVENVSINKKHSIETVDDPVVVRSGK